MSEEMYEPQTLMGAFGRGEYDDVLRLAMPHAQAGNPDAQCMIALLYQCGLAVERSARIAEKWLLRAAEQDSPIAWNNLGTLYLTEWPELPKDREKARRCYERAKELGFDQPHAMED